jgi:2'-phosphotransferase
LVDSSDKQRFQLKSENGIVYIRAAQGHTVKVVESDQLLQPVTEAAQGGAAVHGSYMNVWPLIKASGLSRMARRHIHLSTSPAGSAETISGNLHFSRSIQTK